MTKASKKGPLPPDEQTVNILIVDDQPENLLALEVILDDPAYNLVRAGSGREALRCLMNDSFALIILDVNMPNLDGFETAALIREHQRSCQIPILFVTGVEKADIQIFKGYAVGAVDYIIKPVVGEILRAKVAIFANLHKQNCELAAQKKSIERINRELSKELASKKRYEQQIKNLNQNLLDRSLSLQEANAKLTELDRLKSMFIASMSHELRTPLNVVIGFSSILLKEWLGPLNDEQKKRQTLVLKSGKHLLALINDVIDVSKIEAGMLEINFEDFDLAELMAEVEQTFDEQVRSHGLSLNIQKLRVPMRTDRRCLLQCMFNLVGNAVNYTEKGSITVTVRHNEEKDIVNIDVSDTGIGIEAADQSRLFKAFSRIPSRLSATVPGTGLGLYLSKKMIVDILQGTIYVTSRGESGSTFSISIPRRLEIEPHKASLQTITTEVSP